MGLTWSGRVCKEGTMVVAKANITEDIKDDVWLLWNTAKLQPKLKASLKADGLGLTKDTFDGHRWKIIWFHTCGDNSLEEVIDEDTGEEILVWQQKLNVLTQKWTVRLAAMKDALVDSDDEGDQSVEDPYA